MNSTRETIHIAFGCDDNYAQHLGVAIASILANSLPNESFHFYVVDGGISHSNKEKLSQLKSIKDFDMDFIDFDMNKISEFPPGYTGKSAYLRLFLPELIPELDKVLYLDSDLVVLCPLSELWNLNLQEKALGAVTDFHEYTSNKTIRLSTASFRFNLSNPGFNSGVLLIDLDAIRKTGLFIKCQEWLNQNKEKALLCDQDALNVIFDNCHCQLPPEWNIQYHFECPQALIASIENKRIKELSNNPTHILHFVTTLKPWKYLFTDQKIADYYYRYLDITPWKGWRPKCASFKEFRRYLRQTNAFFYAMHIAYSNMKEGLKKLRKALFL